MKKAVSLLLALALMASALTACGTPDGDSDNGASKGEKGKTFYIGGIGPVTGDNSIYGLAVRNGAQIAIDEINEAGGINGYKIAYKFQDDESDAEKAVNAYNTLKDWGMQILMGTVTSTPCVAVADKTAADGIFQLTPSGSDPNCIKNDNVFQVCFTDPNQGLKSAQYIGEAGLAKKVAVIYDSSNGYSAGITEAFIAESENQPFEVVVSEAFTGDSKTDFSVQLQKAKAAEADMVFLPIYYQEASLIIQQADKMGYEPLFCGGDGLDGLLSVENFDTSLAEGVVLLTPFVADADDERTKNFVSKYKEDYKDTPNQFAADAYDAIYIIKAAIEKANLTPDKSAAEIGTAIKNVMTKISVSGLTGENMSWEAGGTVNKLPNAVKIVDGAYKGM